MGCAAGLDGDGGHEAAEAVSADGRDASQLAEAPCLFADPVAPVLAVALGCEDQRVGGLSLRAGEQVGA